MLKLNNQSIDSQLGWEIGGIWYSTAEIKTWSEERQTAAGIVNEPEPEPVAHVSTLEELKLQKIAEINIAFESAMNQVKSGYPQDEILTWAKQESEARAYLADTNAATPLLDGYVQVKQVTKAALANAIVAKADLFATISGQLVGKRQSLEDEVNAATLETIAAIVW